jgi:hypothetical protein
MNTYDIEITYETCAEWTRLVPPEQIRQLKKLELVEANNVLIETRRQALRVRKAIVRCSRDRWLAPRDIEKIGLAFAKYAYPKKSYNVFKKAVGHDYSDAQDIWGCLYWGLIRGFVPDVTDPETFEKEINRPKNRRHPLGIELATLSMQLRKLENVQYI